MIKYLLFLITIYIDKLEVLRKTRFWGPQSRPSSLTLSFRNILNSYTPNNQHFQKFQISKNLESFHFTERERWQTNWLLSLVQPFCEKSNNLLTCLTTTRNTYNVSGRTKVCGENLNIHATGVPAFSSAETAKRVFPVKFFEAKTCFQAMNTTYSTVVPSCFTFLACVSKIITFQYFEFWNFWKCWLFGV